MIDHILFTGLIKKNSNNKNMTEGKIKTVRDDF